jgi:hypothetical protein
MIEIESVFKIQYNLLGSWAPGAHVPLHHVHDTSLEISDLLIRFKITGKSTYSFGIQPFQARNLYIWRLRTPTRRTVLMDDIILASASCPGSTVNLSSVLANKIFLNKNNRNPGVTNSRSALSPIQPTILKRPLMTSEVTLSLQNDSLWDFSKINIWAAIELQSLAMYSRKMQVGGVNMLPSVPINSPSSGNQTHAFPLPYQSPDP